MGGAAGRNGITLQFYDPTGKFTTRAPLVLASAHVTGQEKPTKDSPGSGDWLKEVYVAPDPAGLYRIMLQTPPKGSVPPLTSAASQDVSVSFIDNDKSVNQHVWKTVIGIGSDITVPVGGGKTEKVRLFDTILLCDGDVANDPTNGLFQLFNDATVASRL